MTPRIVHINTARNYRGGERQTELLIRGLAAHNVKQTLVARRGRPLASRVRDLDVEVREVAGGLLSVLRATRGATLIHVHEGRSVYGAYLRALLSGTPYVITRRVDNPIGDHWLAHLAYRRAGCVAAVAPHVAELVRAYDAQIQVSVVHSGSSGFAFDAASVVRIRKPFAGRLLVGHVGALDNDQKGQEYIIRAARDLQLSHPDVQFLLVGGGKDEAMLKGMAAGLSNVRFTGFIDNVGDYLAAFDVLILPSNREGIGSILLDAMERGLPVIASRVGGLPDIVHDGDNGLLIDPARADQLRDAILELRNAPQRREALGANGREFAKGFTAKVMVDKYLEIYRTLIGAYELSGARSIGKV